MSGRPLSEITAEAREALRGIVRDWISEGFKIPPYPDAYYDIFEWLGLDEDNPHGYDTRRPGGRPGKETE